MGERGQVMRYLLSAAAVLIATGASGAEEITKKPNIILIMTDDQGYGDLGCHGNPHLKTPNLDRLHQESVRFTDFHVSPTCSPTRSALVTGRQEFKNGVSHTINERERLTLTAITLPQVLKRAGYRCGIFGKWHLGDEDEYQPGRRGFDEVFIHGAGGIGQSYPGSSGDAPGNKYFDPVIRHNGKFVKTSGYCTDVFFQQALAWIDERKENRPFFVYLTPNAPHEPLDCPPGSEKPYLDQVPANVARFYGMIANIDENVGRLLGALKERKLENNTLVIFMTDNGTATGEKVFNAGMRGKKGTPYTGGTRVPAFWRWPGQFPAGVDVSALTCHWDILPTLAEVAGQKLDRELAKQVEGRSLLPLLKDANAAWGDRYFVTHVGRWPKGQAEPSKYTNASIRDARWQLVFQNDKTWGLYDLKADPGEETDVAEQHPDVVQRLRTAFDAWWKEASAGLVNEDVPLAAENPFKTAYWKQFDGPGPNNVPPPKK
jgi:arylsulfatase A-like enzyme